MQEITTLPRPEKTDLRLGFIPLTDCCVMAVAKERGYFEKYGLDVTLSREASWANIRDKVCVGALDGAHMLAGMPIATTLGLGFYKKPMLTAFSMNLNGNAITVSRQLYERLLSIDASIASDRTHSSRILKRMIDMDKNAGREPVTFAIVYPYSKHNYEIRYWLAAAGIDPDRDVNMRIIPPQYMVENMKAGHIDGFCVGEPWSSLAIKEKAGRTLITGYEIWNNSPEKVFGVTQEWAEKFPNTHLALIMALLESAAWIDQPENRATTAEIIAEKQYINLAPQVIKMSMLGTFQYSPDEQHSPVTDFYVFHRYLANYPWCSHAAWIMTQMYRSGQLDECVNIRKIAETVYRPDIYRQAAGLLGMSCPISKYKNEGAHAEPWQLQEDGKVFTMGADRFMDASVFNPSLLMDYLAHLPMNKMKVDYHQLGKLNP